MISAEVAVMSMAEVAKMPSAEVAAMMLNEDDFITLVSETRQYRHN